jgi:CheY-like chemotaxis protein
VAQEINVSLRQGQRDHLEAIEALGSILWARYEDLEDRSGLTPEPDNVRFSRGDRSVERGSSLESELLRTGRGLAEAPTPVGDVIKQVVTVILDFARDRQVRLKLALPAGLPPAAVNANALRHVLLSLLSYAVESSDHGILTISAVGTEDAVRLDVAFRSRADSVAIAGSIASGVVRADDPLFVIKSLVEMQGGRVETTVRPGGDVTVSFHLPLAKVTTVLVIDDNPDAIRLIQRYLERGPFRVLHATTGQRALQLAGEARPDAITLDLLMPSQDGLEILRRLKSMPATRHIPVIVCSVFPERAVALSLGATHFLGKPFRSDELLAALREHALPISHKSRSSLPGDTGRIPRREARRAD